MNKDNGQGIELLPSVYWLIYYLDNKLYNEQIFTKYKTLYQQQIMCLRKWVAELTPEIKRQCWENYYN